ncbi:MAG: hypothetical protein GX878_01360 [Firmicutes bacterium]|nr:hypothetical protein [Bacillota bacterium]
MFDIVKDLHIELKTEHVLKGQGIDPAKASALLTRIASEVLDEARALLRPAALFGSIPVSHLQQDRITFDGGFFAGPLVAKAFAGADSLALALCTIGRELEEHIAGLMGTDMMRAIAMDGAGTAAVGEVSRLIREKIGNSAESAGLKVGMKANPGQEGWPIEQQRTLFNIIPAGEIGVELTENCLMIPRKSVSFAIGIGGGMCSDVVSCEFCSKREHCQWRSESKDSR